MHDDDGGAGEHELVRLTTRLGEHLVVTVDHAAPRPYVAVSRNGYAPVEFEFAEVEIIARAMLHGTAD